MNISTKTRKMTLMAILAACIVVLQLLTSVIKFGAINPSLVLIPVVLSGILLGYREAAVMGGIFGLIVFFMSAFGMDPGGYILFNAQPFITFLLCMVKGIMAGLLSGLSYRFCKFSKNNPGVNAILPAALAPVVNTGLFCLSMFLFYRGILADWASGVGADVFTYMLTGLVGVNFIFEFVCDLVICPILARTLVKINAR